MHTSGVLRSSDFEYFRLGPQGPDRADFEAFCPDFHRLDRVAVVSPRIEDGVLNAACALLALTTRFYDDLRARPRGFFDYPQHFALVGRDENRSEARSERPSVDRPGRWDAWSALDVWPDNKWLTAPPTYRGMLQKVFDLQINRLFWPEGFEARETQAALPAYARDMLDTSLKAVYLYAPTTPNLEIRGSQRVREILRTCRARLPPVSGGPPLADADASACGVSASCVERLRRVPVADYLATMSSCFADRASGG